MIQKIDLGSAGEHLVCADLIMNGLRAFQSSQGLPYDVIGDMDGRLLRFAVKSTRCSKPREGRPKSRPTYQVNLKRDRGTKYSTAEADFIAIVGLDIKRVAYLPVAGSPSRIHIDPPGEIIYTNTRGKKTPGMCPSFDSLSWPAAYEKWTLLGMAA